MALGWSASAAERQGTDHVSVWFVVCVVSTDSAAEEGAEGAENMTDGGRLCCVCSCAIS